jgi:hypothetical protein
MQTLKQIYRSTYGGEQVISKLTLESGDWETQTEFVPNSVFTTHTTNQAVAIGNGESRLALDLSLFANHKAGMLGENRLQTYGCNAIYRDFAPDFLIAVGPDTGGANDIIDEIAASGYAGNHIVYSNTYGVVNHPGKFYLIPQNVHYDSGALAAYMACFDGHKKVYLVGYDNYIHDHESSSVYSGTPCYQYKNETFNGAFFELSLGIVMKTYPDVEFVRVMPTAESWCPETWMSQLNFRQISTRDFVIEADLG